MTVVGIEVRGRHLAALVRNLVLAQPNVQITIAIDVTAGKHLSILELRFRCPNPHSWTLERAARRAFEKKQPAEVCAEKIWRAIAIEVCNNACKDQSWRLEAEWFGFVSTIWSAPKN